MKLPLTPPTMKSLLDPVMKSRSAARLSNLLMTGVGPAPDDRYLHWDRLRHLTPPNSFTTDEWWLAIKIARQALCRRLPLVDKAGRPFHYLMPDLVLRALNQIDRDAGGNIQAPEPVTNPQTRDSYLVRSLIEEAITSSQLEGAATTHRVAKEMLRQGRKPLNRGEQMIANNYRAMQVLREWRGKQLTTDMVMELQAVLTERTLDNPSAAGRFRRSEEAINVVDTRDSTLLHDPPDAAELPDRVQLLCDFANDASLGPFMHPVIRAVVLHFWLAYDHPFVDGNGRTARALFYWSMAEQGYWLMEYVSISRILRQAPSQYARAFLYVETDDNDLTYFIVHQLDVIQKAIAELHDYLARKTAEVRVTLDLIRQSPVLRDMMNHRQVALLDHALKHPDATYTIEGHRRSHDISYATARADLLGLADLALLDQAKVGREFVFFSFPDLRLRLTDLAKKRGRVEVLKENGGEPPNL